MRRKSHLAHTVLVKQHQHQQTCALGKVHFHFHQRIRYVLLCQFILASHCLQVVDYIDHQSVHALSRSSYYPPHCLLVHSHCLEFLQKKALVSRTHSEICLSQMHEILSNYLLLCTVLLKQTVNFLHV